MDVIQSLEPTTTVDSAADGRLKVSVGGCTHGKKKCLKCVISKSKKKVDGKGGPGVPASDVTSIMTPTAAATPSLPSSTPGMGVTVTPNTYSPQQRMQMASMGMAPVGSAPQSTGTTKPAPYSRMTNKPHRVKQIRFPRVKKPKKVKALKAVIGASKVKRGRLSF